MNWTRRSTVVVLLCIGMVLGTVTSALANEYTTATEQSADYGSQVTRTDNAVTCTGSGTGFVFSDLWQGIQDDDGWIEVGTSYCDYGDTAAKWVWARKTSSGSYYESVLKRNTSLASHTFKIKNTTGGFWNVYIDGTTYVTAANHTGFANSADVGLEVTSSRMSSTQSATYEGSLLAWISTTYAQSWSGEDSCYRSSSLMSGKWITSSLWRHSLNVSGYSNSTCP